MEDMGLLVNFVKAELSDSTPIQRLGLRALRRKSARAIFRVHEVFQEHCRCAGCRRGTGIKRRPALERVTALVDERAGEPASAGEAKLVYYPREAIVRRWARWDSNRPASDSHSSICHVPYHRRATSL